MLDAVLAALRCPVCGGELACVPGALRCQARGHSFDLARHGYAHLGTGRRLPDGDTAQMVAARSAYLDAGLYEPIAQAVADALPAHPRLIADAGAGIGYYLARTLDRAPGATGLALDVSKPALRRAARCHPRAAAVLADTWTALPLADRSVDALLNVFAPRNGGEFARVLAPGGRLIVVTPRPDHLAELRAELGLLDVDPEKDERLAASLPGFVVEAERELRWTADLPSSAVRDLIAMGPNAFHGPVPDLGPRAVTIAVRIGGYAPLG